MEQGTCKCYLRYILLQETAESDGDDEQRRKATNL